MVDPIGYKMFTSFSHILSPFLLMVNVWLRRYEKLWIHKKEPGSFFFTPGLDYNYEAYLFQLLFILVSRLLIDLLLLELICDRRSDEQGRVGTDYDTQQDRERKASDRAATQDEDTQHNH